MTAAAAFSWLFRGLAPSAPERAAPAAPELDPAQLAILALLQACSELDARREWNVRLGEDGAKQRSLSVSGETEDSFTAAVAEAARALRAVDDSAPLRPVLVALLQACRAFTNSFFMSPNFNPENVDRVSHKRIAKAPQFDWRQACETAAKCLPPRKWRAPWPQGYSLY
jgi:hypothetical protein